MKCRNRVGVVAGVIGRMAVGLILVASALGKIRDPYSFLGIIYEYDIVHGDLALVVGSVVPWLELGIGLCFLTDVLVGGNLLLSFGLLVTFVVVQISVLIRGQIVECGCFSVSGEGQAVGIFTLARTLLILTVVVVLFWWHQRPIAPRHTNGAVT